MKLTSQQVASQLPIYQFKQDIIEAVSAHQVVIVEGPTGSGKTTQLPRILMGEAIVEGAIGVTQPRRIAAVSVASRIAEEEGVTLGKEVGYTIRFDDMTSPDTQIKVMTDGILLREARSDGSLGKYGLIVIDEAHERSLNIDTCLGLLHRLIKNRPDFKVVVSSATLKPEEFQRFFSDVAGEVPLVTVTGRTHPIEIIHRKLPQYGDSFLVEGVVREVGRIVRRGDPGHVLVFLSGQAQIENAVKGINGLGLRREMAVLPLYGRLTREEQELVFKEMPGRRKVILATNIAETSITVDGTRYVIDSGLAKVPRFEARTGITTLREEMISQASAAQRAGRAGRTEPGEVIRLYSRGHLARQPHFTDVEINRTELTEVVLRLIGLGVRKIEAFAFPTSPPRHQLRNAVERLEAMGAIDRNRDLTDIGKRMVPFPLSPPLARMIVEAAFRFPDVVDEVLVVGAFLSARSPLLFPMGEEVQARRVQQRFKHPMGDPISNLLVYRAFVEAPDRAAFCKQHYIDLEIMKFIRKAHAQMTEIAEGMNIEVRRGGKNESVVRSFATAFADKLLLQQRHRGYVSLEEARVVIHPGSSLYGARQRVIVAGEFYRSSRTWARHCCVVRPEWVAEVNPVAAKRWRLGRGKKGRKGRKARYSMSEKPFELMVGKQAIPVKWSSGRPRAIIPLELVPRLQQEKLDILTEEQLGYPAQIAVFKGSLARGVRLGKLLKLLPHLSLPESETPLFREELDGAILSPEKNVDTMVKYLSQLLVPMKPARGKRGGWLAIVANGMGEYWFEVIGDYWAAVQTCVLSLEELISRVDDDGPLQQIIQPLNVDLNRKLDAMESDGIKGT